MLSVKPRLYVGIPFFFGMLRRSSGYFPVLRIQTLRQFRRSFTVLGIETSCDDTCVAVLDILSSGPPVIRQNIIRRSLKLSEPHGGIVPNIVGQFHARELGKVLTQVR